MQGPEEFCRKIDSKLKRSIIITLASVFAAACGASLLMYLFSPDEDFLMDTISKEKMCCGNNGCFLMSMSQSDGTGEFSVVRSELSDGIFSAVILAKNYGDRDIILKPADFCVYATDVQNGGKPQICCVNMCEDVTICAGCETEFAVSAIVPQGFSYDGCKASAVISSADKSKCFGLMLN